MTKEKKNAIDGLFDFAERVVDGVSPYLKEDEDDEKQVVDAEYVEIKQRPLLKSDAPQTRGPREVTLKLKAFAKKNDGGVAILAETTTHDIVKINLSKEDWKTLCDNADWIRMVKE